MGDYQGRQAGGEQRTSHGFQAIRLIEEAAAASKRVSADYTDYTD